MLFASSFCVQVWLRQRTTERPSVLTVAKKSFRTDISSCEVWHFQPVSLLNRVKAARPYKAAERCRLLQRVEIMQMTSRHRERRRETSSPTSCLVQAEVNGQQEGNIWPTDTATVPKIHRLMQFDWFCWVVGEFARLKIHWAASPRSNLYVSVSAARSQIDSFLFLMSN